jgi:dihydroorotase
MFFSRLSLLVLACAALLPAQYDLVLHGGHVIDPGNGIDAVMDVAVTGNTIAAVQANIPASQARKVIDVSGLYVMPGLIDLHAHVFGYAGALPPDEAHLIHGSTTIVDAGGSGWRTFDEFRRTVIAHSKTRVLVSLNIVGRGMIGEPYESDTTDMDPQKTADMIMKNRDVIVGIKTAHFGGKGWTAIDSAVAAGKLAHVPVMVDDKIFTNVGRTSREELLDHLRPGDTHTHMYNDRQLELIDRITGKVQPYMFEARKRGVQFDLGHGGGSFLWPVASKATSQGFWPDTISTDLHDESILIQQPDMPNCMSKMMLLGMSLPDAVLRSTVNPAKYISRYPELGTLGTGKNADIAVLELQTGVFAFKDSWGAKRLGTKQLDCVLTVRGGHILFDRDGREAPDWNGKGDQVTSSAAGTQVFDLLLKNGHVIDPANHRNERLDVAVAGNKIVRVGRDLPTAQARIVVDLNDYLVVPGLIDINAHLNAPASPTSVQPDPNMLPSGVTTAVDAGDADAKSFEEFKRKVIDHSHTRVLAFLDGDKQAAEELMRKYPNIIVQPAGGSAETISSGLNKEAVVLARANLAQTMSRYLNKGLTIDQIIERTTVNAARAIHRPELGTLNDGAVADIAVLEVQHGTFRFLDDSSKAWSTGDRRLNCVLTVRNGRIVWDSAGLGATDWVKAGPYTNFK